jgi:hypothetical protein
MSGFAGVTEYVDAGERVFSFRKSPVQVTSAGIWFDMSMSPGNPVPQYYAASPLVATQMKQSTDGGFFHGSSVTTISAKKYIKSFLSMATSATGLPMPMILCDYLLYYPFIDEGTTDDQETTNSLTLPRYTDGLGVQVMCVNVAAGAGGQTFNFTYTNSDGTAGRVSQTCTLNTATYVGALNNTATVVNAPGGPFIGLQSGDKGVRSIEKINMISGTDVGLFTLVLVKPLFTTQLLEQTAPNEESFLIEKGSMPEIQDDAYLNIICLPNGSITGVTYIGLINTIFA